MSSFDEWWEKNYMLLSADRTEAEDIYNIGAQSRQAEIDELKKSLKIYQEKLMRIQIAISNRLGDDEDVDLILNYFDKILKGNQS